MSESAHAQTPQDHNPQDGTPGQPLPSYGPPPGADGRTTVQSGLVITSFVLGLLSVLGFVFLGPVAIVLAVKGRRQVDEGQIPATERPLATVGLVLGIIGTVFLVLAVVVVIGFLVLLSRQSGA